ncbi:MAG: DUF1015 family protein [Micromonosporaceae bacterium]|nr:DUF1015 family protein [Micromonosporaceae bacterium]
MTIAHPISRVWVSAGGTGAQNYDEFADEAEITTIIEQNPASALAIEMPHRAPEAVAAGRSFAESLPAAADRLKALQADGRYRAAEQSVAVCRITGDGGVAYGLFCMIDTDQISTSADEPGLVIRNEDVFIDKVRERVALAEATGHLLSPVLLLQTGKSTELQEALRAATERLGDPDVTDTDQQGRTHAVWAVGSGEQADELLALAGGGELIVADGNHRSLAAQTGGLSRFLALVTTPDSVVIRPYHRLVSELTLPLAELLDLLRAQGGRVDELSGRPDVPATGGVVHLYADGAGHAVRLSAPDHASVVERLDHAVVEHVLFRKTLGLDPGDKRITYVGGDYPAEWLCDEVDAGRAALAVLIAPVIVDDFVAVNLDRQRLPRKSTWFTPKARAGLVLVDLR